MFDFSIYKGNTIYFRLFDGYLKEKNIKKDAIFKKLYINHCSYRRCRNAEYKISKEIIDSLANYCNLKRPSEKLINQLETVAERIYNNMYYKIYTTYEEDLKFLDELINDKSLLFPILELLKLFLVVNSKKSFKVVYNDNIEIYEHIKKYRLFLSNDLRDILDILSLFFDKDLEDSKWCDTYNNPMSYQILSSRASIKENHIGAIYYANKAKELLVEDMNIRRLITVNLTIINSLLNMGNYDKAYKMIISQMHGFISLKLEDFNCERNYNLMIITLLGMKQYEKVIEELENKDDLTIINFISLLLSYYFVDNDKYKEYLIDNSDFDFTLILDEYLKTRDKRLLLLLPKETYIPIIIKILKEL